MNLHVRIFVCLVIFGTLFSSCSEKRKKIVVPAGAKNPDSLSHLNIDTLIAPMVTLLDTCPKPMKIKVPKKAGGTYVAQSLSGPKTIPLLPPETKSVTITANMLNYNTDKGLPLSSISCGYRDRKGNLWFGTFGAGVTRYDGKSFVTYTNLQGLADDVIWCITEDSKGNMWFGTANGGASRYDGKEFTTFTTTEGLGSNEVRGILEDKKGTLWFGTNGGGVSRYIPTIVKTGMKPFMNYTTDDGLPNITINSITEDSKGNLWFGTNCGIISRYDSTSATKDKKFVNYTIFEGIGNISVKCIAEDNQGNIWCATYGRGVFRFKPTEKPSELHNVKNYTMAEGLAGNDVRSILTDKEGTVWFATNDSGVSRYDSFLEKTTGKAFENFTKLQGLANNTVNSITEDKSGNLWFGTQSDGISRYDGRSVISYSAAQGLANDVVFCITEDHTGKLWFGTEKGGTSCYDGKTFVNYNASQGLAHNVVFSITEDNSNRLWFGTNGGGASCYDGQSFTNYTTAQGLPNYAIRCIKKDKNGDLWFGSKKGVSRYDGKSFWHYGKAQGLADNNVWYILEDNKGYLWFATNDGGISRFDGKSFVNFNTGNGLANNSVLSIAQDNMENLWFGTLGGGVSRYDGTSFISFTTAQGLSDNLIAQIVIDSAGNVILGTNMGLTYITGFKSLREETKPISGVNNLSNAQLDKLNYKPVIEIYNNKTGYPIKDVNVSQGSMYLDKKGMLWAGTGDKLIRFDHDGVHHNSNPPEVVLQNMKINNENICWFDLKPTSNIRNTTSILRLDTAANITDEGTLFGSALTEELRNAMRKKFSDIQFTDVRPFYHLPENLVLPFNHNHFTFEFAAIEPARPSQVRYQYMLEGNDVEWSPVTNETSAPFGNIHEGTYTFKVKAQSPDGVWSKPITYRFEVLPPWYRTWWAYSFYFLAGSFLLYLIFRWRTAALRREKEKLEQTVQERTAEVVQQKEIVEEKNHQITDSINYALRIQQAILPHKGKIASSFPQSFVLFKPKDIVSGDFYFFAAGDANKNTRETGDNKESQTVTQTFFIAAADCTGHGVPGAFMSMIGYERLTDAVQQSNNVGDILSILNKGIKNTLHQSENTDSTRDGMDIALVNLEYGAGIKLKFAGANRPLWIIRKNTETIEEIKATKKAIGGFTEDGQLFESHETHLYPGDTFYIFSDGYADLFSAQGKKLTTKKLKQMLLSIHDKSMPEQGRYLDQFATDWMGNAEQIDDILVIGIRV